MLNQILVEVNQGWYIRMVYSAIILFGRKTRNSMIRNSGVSDVGAAKSGHVTVDATVIRAAHAPDADRETATIFLVTTEAALPVIFLPFFSGGPVVRVVAGGAVHFLFASQETPAGAHLFEVANGPLLIPEFWRKDEHGNKQAPRKARPVVGPLPPASFHSGYTLKMALLADGTA
jgi:hypothetical protein